VREHRDERARPKRFPPGQHPINPERPNRALLEQVVPQQSACLRDVPGVAPAPGIARLELARPEAPVSLAEVVEAGENPKAGDVSYIKRTSGRSREAVAGDLRLTQPFQHGRNIGAMGAQGMPTAPPVSPDAQLGPRTHDFIPKARQG